MHHPETCLTLETELGTCLVGVCVVTDTLHGLQTVFHKGKFDPLPRFTYPCEVLERSWHLSSPLLEDLGVQCYQADRGMLTRQGQRVGSVQPALVTSLLLG